MKQQNEGNCSFGYEYWYTLNGLNSIIVENSLEPICFTSSVVDFSDSCEFVTLAYNLLTRKLGKRMGWVAKRV